MRTVHKQEIVIAIAIGMLSDTNHKIRRFYHDDDGTAPRFVEGGDVREREPHPLSPFHRAKIQKIAVAVAVIFC
jgi:hypothetical protein